MRIGIITINDRLNYGNRLQNYAVQRVIEEIGGKGENIENTILYNDEYFIKKYLKKIISYIYFNLYNKNKENLNVMLKYNRFLEFNDKYIHKSKYKIINNNIPSEVSNKYDYFIIGSDQIWNPSSPYMFEGAFCTFAKKGQRIAYSPSFGIEKLPDEYKEKYKRWIKEIDFLSVREDAGANIIRELTGREAIVLLDPTMMLSANDWLKIAKKPKLKNKFNKRYILTYFLGNKSLEVENKINKIAKDNGLQIINLLDINDKYIYSVDPSEFIWLINNCELMCTDSFHGAVFSLIMKRPFIVFERKSKGGSMNSRLETLLSKFDMECRLDKNICNNEQVFNVDFENVDRIIDNEKEKTFNYLKNALNIK